MIRVEGNEHFVQIRGPQELYFEDELTRRNKTSKCTLKDFMKEAHQSWDSIDSDARTRFENQYKTLCQAANVLPNSTAAAYQNPKRARPAASKKRGRTAPPRFETNDFDSGTAVQVQEEDESWRECTVYRSKKTDGGVVLWFPETDEYEGLEGNYSVCGDVIKDGDGDPIPSRACQQVSAATTVVSSPDSKTPEEALNDGILYTLELTRKSKVVSWDSRMYDDCNGDEAESSSREHQQAAVRYDVDRISLSEILAIEDDRRGTCDMVADLYMSGKDIWESAESAENGAQEAIASALKRVRSGNESNLELASQEMMDKYGDSMDKTKVPDFGGKVTRSVMDGRVELSVNESLFLDCFGCDIYNVVVTEIKVAVRVLSDGDTNEDSVLMRLMGSRTKQTARKSTGNVSELRKQQLAQCKTQAAAYCVRQQQKTKSAKN